MVDECTHYTQQGTLNHWVEHVDPYFIQIINVVDEISCYMLVVFEKKYVILNSICS